MGEPTVDQGGCSDKIRQRAGEPTFAQGGYGRGSKERRNPWSPKGPVLVAASGAGALVSVPVVAKVVGGQGEWEAGEGWEGYGSWEGDEGMEPEGSGSRIRKGSWGCGGRG